MRLRRNVNAAEGYKTEDPRQTLSRFLKGLSVTQEFESYYNRGSKFQQNNSAIEESAYSIWENIKTDLIKVVKRLTKIICIYII